MMVTGRWQSEQIGTDNRWGSLYGSNLTSGASVVPSVSGNGFYAAVPALTGQTNTVIAAIHDVPFFRSSALRCGVPLRTENTGLESGATPMCRALDPIPHSVVMNTTIGNQQSAIGNRYTFQGREIDWTTGLYDFRARWYNPETGRWLSKDPIGISGGLNMYVAFENNPVNYTDPYGLETHWEFDPGYWHFEGRESRNSNLPSSPSDALDQGGIRLPPSMAKYHQNGGKPDSKFIFPDGREAVYDGDTCELMTGPKGGTFNYVNPALPSRNPLKWPEIGLRGLGHFFADMLPYYIGGNVRGEG